MAGKAKKGDNKLYYGDNLDILREYVPDDCADLIYLDPPFKSDASYNILFGARGDSEAIAQIHAFDDTWTWDKQASVAYHEVMERGGDAATTLKAFNDILGKSTMLAYLAMMTPRLQELHRVLKPTGSIVLHCDPTASHYLKLLMDAVFGAKFFRNEIAWHYSGWNKRLKHHFERRHDILLFYGKSAKQKFNSFALPWASRDEYLKVRKQKLHVDDDGREYVLSDAGGGKRVKRYLEDAMEYGKPVDDVWDIDKLNNSSSEYLGYPTQKPMALLDRIIRATTDEGDLVLDPFCGCGTSVEQSQRLRRKWIGIDITAVAIRLIRDRLQDDDLALYRAYAGEDYEVIGEPTDLEGATELANQDRHQFEQWALGLVDARSREKTPGADAGIDGIKYFQDSDPDDYRTMIVSVKSGKPQLKEVRDLRGVVEREEADLGVFVTLQEPTKKMVEEAAAAGIYQSAWGQHQKLQILTIEELLDGRKVDRPYVGDLPKPTKAVKKKPKDPEEKAQVQPLDLVLDETLEADFENENEKEGP